MKFRKFIVFLLSFLLCLTVVAGCDGAQTPNDEPDDDTTVPPPASVSSITFDEGIETEYVNWYGRYYYNEKGESVYVNNAASGFEVKFEGTLLKAEVRSRVTSSTLYDMDNQSNKKTYLGISVDGGAYERRAISQTEIITVKLAENLADGVHTVKVLKSTEAMATELEVISLTTDGSFTSPPEMPSLKIEVYGDSITAGYGALKSELGQSEAMTTEQQDALSSYGFTAAEKLGGQANVFCVSGACMGSYGLNCIPNVYTRTDPYASGQRLWDFTQYVPDAVIIDLGTNDIIQNYLSAISDFENVFKSAYKSFVQGLRDKYPDAAIIMCFGTFKYGSRTLIQDYNTRFIQWAGEFNGEIGNVYSLQLSACASYHATKAEHAAYAESLAAKLQEVLGLA